MLKNIDTVKKEGDKLYKKKKAVYYTDYAQILYDKVSAEESLKAISNDKSDTSLKDAYENAKSLKKAGISYEDQAKFYLDYKKIKFKKKSEVKGSKTDLYIKSLDSLKISSTKKAILLYSTPGYFGKNLSISKYKTAFGLSNSEERLKMENYLND